MSYNYIPYKLSQDHPIPIYYTNVETCSPIDKWEILPKLKNEGALAQSSWGSSGCLLSHGNSVYLNDQIFINTGPSESVMSMTSSVGFTLPSESPSKRRKSPPQDQDDKVSVLSILKEDSSIQHWIVPQTVSHHLPPYLHSSFRAQANRTDSSTKLTKIKWLKEVFEENGKYFSLLSAITATGKLLIFRIPFNQQDLLEEMTVVYESPSDLPSLLTCDLIVTLDQRIQKPLLSILCGTHYGDLPIIEIPLPITENANPFISILSITKSPVTACAWMPDGAGALFACGDSHGKISFCDRRQTLHPTLHHHEYNSKPIWDVAWPKDMMTILIAQQEALIFCGTFEESSRHSLSKHLASLAKMKAGAEPADPKGHRRFWADIVFPKHRRPAVQKAVEYPVKTVAAQAGFSGWGFDDGNFLVGSITDIDTKMYQRLRLYSWSLIETPKKHDLSYSPVADDSSMVVEQATEQIIRATEAEKKAAVENGIHVLGYYYTSLEGKLKPFVKTALKSSEGADAELQGFYAGRCGASTNIGTTTDPREAMLAYGGTIGLVHIVPTIPAGG